MSSRNLRGVFGSGYSAAMKKALLAVFIGVGVGIVSAPAENRWALGGRYHSENTTFPELPFGKGDLSGFVAYEYVEAAGAWQVGLDVCPRSTKEYSTNGTDTADYVLTPQLNLVLKEKYILMGGGALISYVARKDPEWTDLYYQFLAGLHFELKPSIHLNIVSYYPFQEFADFKDFEPKALEYGAWLSLRF